MSSVKKSIRFSEMAQQILDERDKELFPTESSFIEEAVRNFSVKNNFNSEEIQKKLEENLQLSKKILEKFDEKSEDDADISLEEFENIPF